MATHVFRSTDSGAPVLDGLPNSLQSLLKALLVGGVGGVAYGSGINQRAAVGGWTVVAEDVGAEHLVLRNSLAHGGSGCVVELAAGTAGATITVGSDFVSAAVLHPTWSRTAIASDTVDGSAREWFVIADETTCYVATKPTAATLVNAGIVGFGDWQSYYPGDASRYMLLRSGFGANDRQLNSMGYVGTSNAATTTAAISTGGIDSSLAEAKALIIGFGATNVQIGWSLNGSLPATNPADGKVWTFPAYLRVAARNEISGRLRGVHMSPNMRDVGGFIEVVPGLSSETGGTLLQVRHHTQANDNIFTAVFFDTGAWL